MNQKVLVPEENVPSLEQLKIPARVATKNASNLDKGIVGKYDGEFPLTSATVGGVYFVPQTKKYYECLKAFDGTTSGQTLSLPNADFKELSILENKNKLDNLCIIQNKRFVIKDNNGGAISFVFYKLGKIVFTCVSGANFQTTVIRNIGQLPEGYIPIDTVAFTIGNSYSPNYLIEMSNNGNISVYGGNVKLNNIPFRVVTYFTY